MQKESEEILKNQSEAMCKAWKEKKANCQSGLDYKRQHANQMKTLRHT